MSAERIFNAILGLSFVFYLILAAGLRELDGTDDLLGAGGFPRVIGILALLVLALITIHTTRHGKAVRLPLFDPGLPEGHVLRVNMVLLVGYIVLLNVLGFAVSTMLYLFVAPTSFGYCKWRTLTLFSIAGAVLLVGVFGTAFYVPLPRGMGLFRELSYLVY